jgi:hypothetical protein
VPLLAKTAEAIVLTTLPPLRSSILIYPDKLERVQEILCDVLRAHASPPFGEVKATDVTSFEVVGELVVVVVGVIEVVNGGTATEVVGVVVVVLGAGTGSTMVKLPSLPSETLVFVTLTTRTRACVLAGVTTFQL